eukprot:gene18024-biopygen3903
MNQPQLCGSDGLVESTAIAGPDGPVDSATAAIANVQHLWTAKWWHSQVAIQWHLQAAMWSLQLLMHAICGLQMPSNCGLQMWAICSLSIAAIVYFCIPYVCGPRMDTLHRLATVNDIYHANDAFAPANYVFASVNGYIYPANDTANE